MNLSPNCNKIHKNIFNKTMKGNFWHKFFRKGYDAHGYGSMQANGNNAKTDAKTTRTRLNRLLDKLFDDILHM